MWGTLYDSAADHWRRDRTAATATAALCADAIHDGSVYGHVVSCRSFLIFCDCYRCKAGYQSLAHTTSDNPSDSYRGNAQAEFWLGIVAELEPLTMRASTSRRSGVT